VLYTQYNNADASGTSSQNFEAANDAFDDFLADDFTVPTGESWSIASVNAQGLYFNGTGPAASFNVYFYANNSATNLPAAQSVARTNQTFVQTTTDFAITLSPAVVLNPGTYWVSVQANQDFTPAGQWAWTDRSVQSGAGAAWQNPGGGFDLCTIWTRATSCIASRTGPDQVFSLTGTIGTQTAYFNPNTIVFNDGVKASVYPSTIDVSGVVGSVTKVTVTLNGLTHAFPTDIDMLLVGPGGQQATIFSDVPSTAPAAPVNITLDDAGGPIPGSPLASGTYVPTNAGGANLDSFPLPAPVVSGLPTGPSALSIFNGIPSTGTWTLYVIDDSATGTGTLASWSLNITSSGPPVTTTTFSSTDGPVTINDHPSGGILPAEAYPSAIGIGGFVGTISHMTVTLKNLKHTFPTDIDLMLAGPGAQNATIMSDVGAGGDIQNVTLTLDDAAASALPGTTLASGTYQPTNVGSVDTFPAPAPPPTGLAPLSTFTGTSPNGTWNLWAVDDAGVDGGYLVDGWALNFTGPTAVGLAGLTASERPGGVVVRWRTASESAIAGFNLYRGSTKLNRSPIVARHAGQARGAGYSFVDRTAGSGPQHVYRLELIRPDGTRAFGARTVVASSR
jgi:subtilisin-like proprotein convertase family protein